ncbi:ABC transporter permease [Bowmanella pacifica]|uniref:Transport permease protein n=1 Tax=Bowmanella pacifica TaxID=502051 RepID=A0A917YQ10_9ALTE|nr:ABC transporter permease [Bowmanella pacifica]GGO63651.1 Vi polysaccharide export inner-membrane protein VexB [Bowmanella pacifica]
MSSIAKRSPWGIWKDVIFALFAREIRVGFNDKLGIGWAIVQPVLFIFILSFLRGRLNGGETHGIPTFVFMAFGMVLIQCFLQTFHAGARAIKKNKALFAFRQVQPISVVLASGLFELLVKIFVSLGMGLMMYFLDLELQLSDPLSLMFYFFSLWLFSLSLGFIFGLIALYIPEVDKIQNLMTRPLFFISGVFFSLQDFPQEYWWLLDWNPILHAIELSRYAAYPVYGQVGVSSGYLAMSVLTSTFLCLSIYQAYWKKAISR